MDATNLQRYRDYCQRHHDRVGPIAPVDHARTMRVLDSAIIRHAWVFDWPPSIVRIAQIMALSMLDCGRSPTQILLRIAKFGRLALEHHRELSADEPKVALDATDDAA